MHSHGMAGRLARESRYVALRGPRDASRVCLFIGGRYGFVALVAHDLFVVLWVLGYAVNIGAWINFLLIAAVVLFMFNVISMLTTRRTATTVHERHEHIHDDEI